MLLSLAERRPAEEAAWREHGVAKSWSTLRGADMVGWRYTARSTSCPPAQATSSTASIAWDEVSDDEGTGIVHIAPGCGKEDFALSAKRASALRSRRWTRTASIVDGFDWLTGTARRRGGAADLRQPAREGRAAIATEQYPHRYPHCWRCGTELVFRLVDEWFISHGRAARRR